MFSGKKKHGQTVVVITNRDDAHPVHLYRNSSYVKHVKLVLLHMQVGLPPSCLVPTYLKIKLPFKPICHIQYSMWCAISYK
jgi:hypothetical protein